MKKVKKFNAVSIRQLIKNLKSTIGANPHEKVILEPHKSTKVINQLTTFETIINEVLKKNKRKKVTMRLSKKGNIKFK